MSGVILTVAFVVCFLVFVGALDLLDYLSGGEVARAAQWDRNPEGEKPQALSAEHESPVAEGDAPNPTP